MWYYWDFSSLEEEQIEYKKWLENANLSQEQMDELTPTYIESDLPF